ncbi:RHS domain-containing protein [Hahella sp. CR1]|uniref:RHS repeat domain-containing protein n=1 Tax=Hahella sp. CR1 TaxID=2992807 RepID=UPI0024427E7F|nr:RHS repeat-associated core domain-containing protein [Hahella sp. CR1]MDG9671420.1 RHS domain-containing protein [Hahella sp. CR1]
MDRCFAWASALIALLLTTVVSAENLYFVHSDHLGIPQAVTDAQQKVVWEAKASPFGSRKPNTYALEFHLRFPGQYYDSESQLHYNYFRDYDPEIGRYIQSDPIGILQHGKDPKLKEIPLSASQSLLLDDNLNHIYAYAKSSPVALIDPFGLSPRHRPKITKDMCKMDCTTLNSTLDKVCKATGPFYLACKAEVNQLVVNCMETGGLDIPECKDKEPCEENESDQ